MSIVYAGLWVGERVYGHYLAERTDTTEPKQVSELATNVFTRIDRTYNHRKPFAPYQGIVFSYLVENERAFLCASTEGFPSRTAFSFLDRIKDEYFNGYEGAKRKSEFSKFLKETAIFFSDPKADKLRALKEKTDDTIAQMSQNYQNMMTRGQHLDELQDSTNLLREEAQEFEKQAKKLKCKLCRDNLKATVCLTITGIVLCVVILAVILVVVLYLGKSNGVTIIPESTKSSAPTTTTHTTTTTTTTTTTPTTTAAATTIAAT